MNSGTSILFIQSLIISRHVLPSEEKLKEMKEREQKRRAEKFAKEHPDLVPLVAPEDLNIKTLFLLGITSDITDQDIKYNHFN